MKKEENNITDTSAMAKRLLAFAEDFIYCHEDLSLTRKYFPCSRAWYSFKDKRGRIIILCSKVTEIEDRMYEISLYASINGKIHSIIGLYDEACDYYYPKRIRNSYDINKYEKSIKNIWRQIKNGTNNKKGIKRSGL